MKFLNDDGNSLEAGAVRDTIDNLQPLFCCKVFNTSEFFVKNLVLDNISIKIWLWEVTSE